MSRRHCPTGIEPTYGPPEADLSIIPPKGIGDSTNNARRVNHQQIEADTFGAPVRVFRKDNFSCRDQACLLANRQSSDSVNQPRTSLDLNNRKKTVLLRDQVDLTCRRSKPACQNVPTSLFQGCRGGIFGGTASFIGDLPSMGTIHPIEERGRAISARWIGTEVRFVASAPGKTHCVIAMRPLTLPAPVLPADWEHGHLIPTRNTAQPSRLVANLPGAS
jgi:hypothetical protein